MYTENRNSHSNLAGARFWRPGKKIRVLLYKELLYIVIGLFILYWHFSSTTWVILGVIICLFGIWQIATTLHVMRTHYITTDNEIAMIRASHSTGIKWNEIKNIRIRERKQGTQRGRPDRIIMIYGSSEYPILLNSSVLSREDENLLLKEIQEQVSCPIEVIQDGLFHKKR